MALLPLIMVFLVGLSAGGVAGQQQAQQGQQQGQQGQQRQQGQQCPGPCPFNWAPVCGLSATLGERTFTNICTMSDWNRCFTTDYQVKAFTMC